jgi:hypothetical protein
MIISQVFILLVFLTFCVAASSALVQPDNVYEDVVSKRLEWEKNCLTTAQTKSGRQEDPRLVLKENCAVYYLHNHKTGGSTMCKTAAANGMKTSGMKENCNVPQHIRYNTHINAHEYIFENKYQFVAQEDKPFHLNVSNNRFVLMTTIRNPMDRVVSHLHHEICGQRGNTREVIQRRMQSHQCMSPPGTVSDLIADPCFCGPHMHAITTDYYVAMLTGCANRMSDANSSTGTSTGSDDWFLPPAKNTCSEVHVEEAKRLLNYFSVILITDTREDFDM